MGLAAADAPPPRRDRLILPALGVVGTAAMLVGGFAGIRSGWSFSGGWTELALGGVVLLAATLVLARFGEASEAPSRRSGGVAASVPRRPTPRPSTHRSAAPPPTIPKWADPLVAPRSASAPSAPPPARARVPAPPAPVAAVSRSYEPARSLDEVYALPERSPDPPRPRANVAPGLRWDADTSEGRGAHSLEVLEELDRIEAELRNFVPLESAPAPSVAVGLEDLVD